jgi:hypothetical protein
MKNSAEVKLLKEYIETVLKEDDGGVASAYADAGIGAGDISAASGAGSGSGSAGGLSKIFLQPFTDVFKTAVGKTKELTTRAKNLVKIGFGTIISTLIPSIKADYSKLFAEQDSQIKKIRSEYKDVYDRTDKALASNDAAFLAFMASPSIALSAWTASKSPGFVVDVLSTVTGGASDSLWEKFKNSNVLDDIDDKLRGKTDGGRGRGRGRGRDKDRDRERERRSSNQNESNLYEEEEKSADSGSKKARAVLEDPRFLKAALDNPEVEKMKSEAVATYREFLEKTYKAAKTAIEKTNSFEELEKLTGKGIQTAGTRRGGRILAERTLLELQLLSEEESKVSEEALVRGVRGAVKKFYVDELTKVVDGVLKVGIPEESQFVKDYRTTIQKIKAL